MVNLSLHIYNCIIPVDDIHLLCAPFCLITGWPHACCCAWVVWVHGTVHGTGARSFEQRTLHRTQLMVTAKPLGLRTPTAIRCSTAGSLTDATQKHRVCPNLTIVPPVGDSH